MRKFNTAGPCFPERHYMVDITSRLEQIRTMVDDGDYFAINRGRQYGKTTTLMALEHFLADVYTVVRLDFQALDASSFEDSASFVQSFASMVVDASDFGGLKVPGEHLRAFEGLAAGSGNARLADLLRVFLRWNRSVDKPLVLIIDEVDSASNNQVYITVEFCATNRSNSVPLNSFQLLHT